MKPLTTYCQLKFLESIFTSLPTIPFNNMILDNNDELNDWVNMLEVIYNKSELYIDDITTLIAKSKNNPYFQKLINQNNSGGSKINKFLNLSSTNGDGNDYLDRINPSSLHYYLNEIYNIKMGIFSNTVNTWKGAIRDISAKESYNINRNKSINNFPGWNILRRTGLPINAAIISDRYFLKYGSSFNYNIFNILSNLIPDDLENVDFHLSIITRTENLENPNNVYNKLNSYLKREFNFKVDFTLYTASKICPHDRDIVTNYYRLNSGDSFDYHDRTGNISSNTKLEYYALNSESENNHTLKLKEFKYVMGKTRYIGSGNNRLLRSIQ